METLIQEENTELWFAWNGSHTVNVRHESNGPDLDCYSIGDFAGNGASFDEFTESISEYVENLDA